MSTDQFWQTIAAQITQLETAASADEVCVILANDRDPYGQGGGGADGFFAGSGGDGTVDGALFHGGWRTIWREASYHWAMQAPDGSIITYVEGDIYKGDRR